MKGHAPGVKKIWVGCIIWYNVFMPKKAIGFLVLGIIIVAVLVYLFVMKGYSGKGTSVSQILPTQNPSTAASESSTQETGSVTSTKLSLVVTSPKDGDTLGSTNAVFKGKTAPGADVFVNDQLGKADANGNFSISVGLDEGSNQIVVSANDSAGNAAEQDLNVTVTSFQ